MKGTNTKASTSDHGVVGATLSQSAEYLVDTICCAGGGSLLCVGRSVFNYWNFRRHQFVFKDHQPGLDIHLFILFGLKKVAKPNSCFHWDIRRVGWGFVEESENQNVKYVQNQIPVFIGT